MHSQHTTPLPRDAPHPFNQCSADITLRTSDSVHFHVHSQVLSQASPVFATMFQLPQPLTSPDRLPADDTISPARPVVDVTEDSRALDPLLRLCYPVRKAGLQHVTTVEAMLEAAIKYDMEWPTEVLTVRLLECAAQGPLQVWAFGCRHRLEHVARRGAEALRVSLPDGEREKLSFLLNVPRGLQALDGVSSGQYFRLLQFLRAGVGDESAASGSDNGTSTSTLPGLTHSLSGSSEMSALLTPPKVASTPAAASVVANLEMFQHLPFARIHGWLGFSEDLTSPDIICRCEDGTELKAHQAILSLYSPVLRAQIVIMNAAQASLPPRQPLEGEGEVQATTTALPVLDLGGPSDAISTLLGICYQHRPQSTPAGRRSADCIGLLTTATRYKIQPAIDLASAQWDALVPIHPHHCYFLARNAAMRGAAAVAATAALRSLWKPEEFCPPWLTTMENAPARTYHQLAVYYNTCCQAAAQVVKKATKAWELTSSERLATAVQSEAVAATGRMYQAVTDTLNRRREALERREVAPKADHARNLRSSLYGGVAGHPSLVDRFKDDLENLLMSLPLDIDVAINKVKLDLR